MRATVTRWRRVNWRSNLVAADGERGLVIVDTRPCATRLVVRLRGGDRRLFEFCHKARDKAAILKHFEGQMTKQEVETGLRFLTERRLILGIDGHYLSLATPAARPLARKSSAWQMPGGHLRSTRISDLLTALRKRTGFRWVLSAFTFRDTPRAILRWGGRLASDLLSRLARWTALRLSGPPVSGVSGTNHGQETAPGE